MKDVKISIPPIKLIPVTKLHVDGKNPNKMSPQQKQALRKNIEEYGFLVPIVTNKDFLIADGEHRWRVAQELDMETVPVIALPVEDVDRRILRQVMNKLRGTHDIDLDIEEYQFIADSGELSKLGSLMDHDPTEFLKLLERDDEIVEDEFEEPKEHKYKIKMGELWQLGNHYLLCGDAASKEDVEKLVKNKLSVVFTSPPYAMQRVKQYGGIPHTEYVNWFKDVAINVKQNMKRNGSFFLNIKEHVEDGERLLYVKKLVIYLKERLGFKFVDEFCWVKKGFPGLVKGRFKNGFEPIFHFSIDDPFCNHYAVAIEEQKQQRERHGKISASGSGFVGGNFSSSLDGKALPSNVVKIEHNVEPLHPAMFPIALPGFFIKAFSKEKEYVFDPFGGSGTTLIACEQLARNCYMMEIDPSYCSVIIERWEQFTGNKARKL